MNLNEDDVAGFNFKPKQEFGEEDPIPEAKPRRGFVASTDEEHFSSSDVYATREEAIKSFPEDNGMDPGDTFWVGQIVEFEPYVNADNILQGLVEEAYDSVGDPVDGWLKNVKSSEEDELSETITRAVKDWLARYKHTPTFFKVERVESYEAPEPEEEREGGQPNLPGIGGQEDALNAIRRALREFRTGAGEAG